MDGLKLDLGCGSRKREGFIGVDRRKFGEVDAVTDLTGLHWEFAQKDFPTLTLKRLDSGALVLPDNSVSEAHCSHFLEHLEHNQRAPERVRFVNELYRVLVPGGKAVIITPFWASNRAYGDFTHADKPVAEMFYAYLSREWRMQNAPDNDSQWHPDGYTCDFSATLSFSVHPQILEEIKKRRANGGGIFSKLFGPKQDAEAYKSHALTFYKEAAQDMVANLVAKKP